MRFYEWLMNEQVYGAMAVGYHRTPRVDNIQSMSADGFMHGSGDTYGSGTYLTYDLKSQLTPYMIESYGPVIVKCQVSLANYLIFDPDIAMKVYGPDGDIRSQVKKLVHPRVLAQVQPMLSHGDEYTSTVAREVIQAIQAKRAWGNMRGVVFTGRLDGKVIVAYNNESVLPLAYAENMDPNVDPETIQWTDINGNRKKAFQGRIRNYIDYRDTERDVRELIQQSNLHDPTTLSITTKVTPSHDIEITAALMFHTTSIGTPEVIERHASEIRNAVQQYINYPFHVIPSIRLWGSNRFQIVLRTVASPKTLKEDTMRFLSLLRQINLSRAAIENSANSVISAHVQAAQPA